MSTDPFTWKNNVIIIVAWSDGASPYCSEFISLEKLKNSVWVFNQYFKKTYNNCCAIFSLYLSLSLLGAPLTWKNKRIHWLENKKILRHITTYSASQFHVSRYSFVVELIYSSSESLLTNYLLTFLIAHISSIGFKNYSSNFWNSGASSKTRTSATSWVQKILKELYENRKTKLDLL